MTLFPCAKIKSRGQSRSDVSALDCPLIFAFLPCSPLFPLQNRPYLPENLSFVSEHALMHILLLDVPFFQNLQDSVPVLQGRAPGHAAAGGYAPWHRDQSAGRIVFPAGFFHRHCIRSCVKCYNQFFLFFSHCYSITTAKPSGISVDVYFFPRSFASFSTFIF